MGTKVVCGMILFFEKKAMLKIWKKSWVPFRSYLLNSTANPVQFECKWAGLAVLFSSTHDFFQIFSIAFFSKKENYPINHFCAHILDAYYFWVRWCELGINSEHVEDRSSINFVLFRVEILPFQIYDVHPSFQREAAFFCAIALHVQGS